MADPTPATAFITASTILSFSVASGGVFAFTATVRRVVNKSWAYHAVWPFLMCLIISYALAQASAGLDSPLGWIIALLNACMLFMSVVGINETVDSAVKGKSVGGGKPQGAGPGQWSHSFFS
jgi:hypothetical protein